MSSKILFLCLTLGAGLFVPFHKATAGTMPRVVISELLWMGSSQSSSDEWIELRNTSSEPIDLSGWSLTKLSGGNTVTMLTIPSGTIALNGYFLIARNPADNSRLAAVPDLVSSSLSLVNSKLQIALRDGAGTLIDTADDGSGSPLAGSYTSGSVWKSMERNPLGADGTVKEGWHTASISSGLDDATKEFGTPGSANSNSAPTIVWNSDTTVQAGTPLQFDASESTDPENDPLTYLWSFGDGTTSDSSTPTKTFPMAGTYSVTLAVSDGNMRSTETKELIAQGPVATIPPQSEQTIQNQMPPAIGDSQEASTVATPKTLRLSELLPNPKGSDAAGEFIELENYGDEEVDVRGWKIVVNKSSYTWKTGVLVPAHGFLLIPRTVSHLALPNSGSNTVLLLAPDASIIDQVAYTGSVSEAESYVRRGTGWLWSGENLSDETNAETGNVPPRKPRPEDYQSFHILFNELVPNPDGNDTNDEFIEVKNAGKVSTDLSGWSITDQRKTFRIPENTVLESGETFALFRPDTKIALKNSGGVLYLLDPSGTIRNGVQYDSAKAGESWSRNEKNRWQWTDPTPGEDNAFSNTAVVESTTGKTKKSGSIITIEATVTAGTGTVFTSGFVVSDGKQAFHIAGSSVLLPDVTEGDRVRATGKITHPSGETKLTVQSEEDVKVGENGDVPQAVPFSKTLTPNMLTSLSGKVLNKRGRAFSLETEYGTLRVSIPSSVTDVPSIANSDALTITGIWKASSGGPRLAPRSAEDIVRDEQPAIPAQENSIVIPEQQKAHRDYFAPFRKAGSWIRKHLWFSHGRVGTGSDATRKVLQSL